MTALLFISVLYQLAREDPEGFSGKVAERLRTMGIPGATNLVCQAPTDDAHLLTQRGEFSRALEAISTSPGRNRGEGRKLARRLSQKLGELNMAPPEPAGYCPPVISSGVLHLLTNSEPYTSSGYTQRSHHVLQAVNARGITAEAVTRLAYPLVVGKWPGGRRERIQGVTYHRLLPGTYPPTIEARHDKSITLLTELVESRGMAAIHTTTNFPNAIVASRVARNCRVPWVYEVRGELERTWLSRLPVADQEAAEESEFYRLARRQETRYAEAADAVIALSEISRRQLIERGVSAEKITVIPNAVDSSLLGMDPDKVALRRELGLPTDKKLVGTVSAVVDYEGIDVLIRALRWLPDEYSVLIVGDGTARPSLEELTRSCDLGDRVLFAGRKDPSEIWKWYSVLDVFALPRHNTPVCRSVTPIKGLSAQALGIPVVASDLPALREITGGLADYVAPDDPETLAAAITKARCGEEGRAWAREHTWEAAGERYLQVYASLGLVPDET